MAGMLLSVPSLSFSLDLDPAAIGFRRGFDVAESWRMGGRGAFEGCAGLADLESSSSLSIRFALDLDDLSAFEACCFRAGEGSGEDKPEESVSAASSLSS